ncbi:MAG: hypothetical protein ACJAW7_003469, partial [Candidatus Azotimanducaceae bacterium]
PFIFAEFGFACLLALLMPAMLISITSKSGTRLHINNKGVRLSYSVALKARFGFRMAAGVEPDALFS